MATKTINNLENLKATLEEKLKNSPTAYTRSTPTTKDFNNSTQLASLKKQIEGIKSEQLGNKWYGLSDRDDEPAAKPEGFFMRGLEGLQKPLNTIAGVTQYALGKGTESSLLKNTAKARKEGLTYGDILKQEGVDNRFVRGTLGFLLDVMFDPVNWATAGTAALIPRVGTGLVKGAIKSGTTKGALEAAGKGLTSNLSKKASVLSKFVPTNKTANLLGKAVNKAGEFKNLEGASTKITSGLEKVKSLPERIAARAVKDAEKYDELIGTSNLEKSLGKGLFGLPAGKVGGVIDDAIRGKTKALNNIPGFNYLAKDSVKGLGQTKGDILADFFDYSPAKRNMLMEKKDEVILEMEKLGVTGTGNKEKADFLSLADFKDPKASIIRYDEATKEQAEYFIRETVKDADGVVAHPLKEEFRGGVVKLFDSKENAVALLEEAGKVIDQKMLINLYKQSTPGLTGVKSYDDFIARIKNTSVRDWLKEKRLLGPKITGVAFKEAEKDAKKLLDIAEATPKDLYDIKPLNNILKGLEGFTTVFKAFKVPLNVGSQVVAYLGNYFMGMMTGLPTWKPKYIESVMTGRKFVSGKMDIQRFMAVFTDADSSMRVLAEKNPTVFNAIFGVNPKEIFNILVKESGLPNTLNYVDEFENVVKAAMKSKEGVSKGVTKASDATNLGDDIFKGDRVKLATPLERKREDVALGINRYQIEETSSMLGSGEILTDSSYEKVRASFAEKAKTSFTYKFADAIVNGMTKHYEGIDQSFKIGNFIYLTKIGLNAEELAKVSRTVNLEGSVLPAVIENGEKLYKITPLAASRVSSEVYMNYSAMPDFVKIMRAIPIVGSPFISFQYAMLPKTAKTLLHNPAYFNKVAFALDEINSGRTPEERMALENKYNSFLNSPSVIKFFWMMNVDVKGYIPHLTMNMLNPSERTYDDSPQGRILKAIDKIPVMQHPIGQVFKDFILQPMVLKGTGQNPQGQFGQPLYPSFDENGKKIDVGVMGRAPYALRTLADAVTPGVAGYLGIPLGMSGMSQEAIDYLPSYAMRSLANAFQGRTSIGKMTKENIMQKSLRTLFSRSGVPTYPLDTTRTNINK